MTAGRFSFRRLFARKAKECLSGPRPLTLSDAASHTKIIDHGTQEPARLVFDGVLPNGRLSLFRQWTTSALELKRHELEDVVLDRTSMMLLKDGCPIVDTNYLQPPQTVTALTLRPQDLIPAATDMPLVAACFDHWSTNYYHWVVHTLPTLHALRREGFEGGLILPRLTAWQDETIRLSGFDPTRSVVTEPGRQYALRRAIYIESVRGVADFSILPSSRETYRTLATRAGVTGNEPRTLDLFIERTDAANRHVSNEAALTQALIASGFMAVRPETLSVAEQIRLFSRARMVVGAMGAGMANIAWCQPGTIVCELVPENHQNPCNLALAMQMGLLYWGELVETGISQETHTAPSLREYDVPELMQSIHLLANHARSGLA